MPDDRSARRGVQATGLQSAPSRTRLGKREWRDIRRARKLGDEGELHAVELHGVRITFKHKRSHSAPAQDLPLPRTVQDGHAVSGSSANAQRLPTTPTGPPDAQRPRQGEGKQGSRRTKPARNARTTAGEDASRASRAPAGGTAGASPGTAQSPSVCSPRRPNSRQRRSANRLVEFMRTKQAQQPAAAEPLQVAERPSPKRAHEDGAREGGGAAEAAAASRRRRIVDVDYEARQEAAAALYLAWRQHTLTTTTNTSPKRALEHGAQEGSGRGGGGQRQLVNSDLSAQRIRYD